MKKLLTLSLLLLLTACSQTKPSAQKDVISLKLNQKIPKSAIIQKNQSYLTTSGAMEQMYVFKENNNTFELMTNKKNCITFIKSTDNIFSSPYGIKEGDTLAKVKKVSKEEPDYMLGWGYYVPLSHNWFAGFGNDKSILVNGKVSLDSKVKLLFKSIYHSKGDIE